MTKIKTEKEYIETLTCPCCDSVPSIRHNIAMDGGEATIYCRCGISITKYSDFNCYIAEKQAITA